MKRLLTLAVVATLAMTGAAHGQITGSIRPDTSPIDVPEGLSTGDAARAVHDDFALCIVKRHHVQVVKALKGPANIFEDNKTLPKLMDTECLTGDKSVRQMGGLESVHVQSNPVSFRGALYKALVRKDLMRHAAVFGADPLVMAGYNSRSLQFADCVVRGDPEGSLSLMKAVAGTSAEQSVLGALKLQMGRCLGPGGGLKFSKGDLVGFIAEAYYREADAAKSTGAD